MLKHYKGKFVAGCDEAGRGCLAGPVFAAAVILPKSYCSDVLNDSKMLSLKKRLDLRDEIEKEAISWSVASVTPKKIDEINILNASFLAMHKAIKHLSPKPSFLIIDGNRFTSFKGVDHECIIKGDGKYMSIAAASILAKTYRDEYMVKISATHPEYLWARNKGYPTLAHRDAILKFGPTKYHRKSFRLLPHNKQGILFD